MNDKESESLDVQSEDASGNNEQKTVLGLVYKLEQLIQLLKLTETNEVSKDVVSDTRNRMLSITEDLKEMLGTTQMIHE